MNYYLAKAKCGHVGRGKYYEVDFPIVASTKSETAQKCKKKAKVKKHLKNAITSVIEISYKDYLIERKKFTSNDYVRAHTKNEIVQYIDLAQTHVCLRQKHKRSFKNRNERINFLFRKQKLMEREKCFYA